MELSNPMILDRSISCGNIFVKLHLDAKCKFHKAVCMNMIAINSILGLTEVQIAKILDQLDAGKGHTAIRTAISSINTSIKWQDFRGKNVLMAIEHPGGGTSQSLIYTCRLCRNAISIIHRGFLHVGTICRIELPISSVRTSIDGKVRACCHLQGMAHFVVLAFDLEIELP